jgi:hypothetical protein
MTVPNVDVTELDGGLGTLPSVNGEALVVIGPASSGPYNNPAAFTRSLSVRSNYGDTGEMVEGCAYHTERRGRAVIPVRCRATVAGDTGAVVAAADGTVGSVTKVGTGTSTPTVNSTHDLPNAAKDVVVRIAVGGTIGTDSTIVYQVSIDGGLTFGYARALGSATHYDLSPELGDVWLDLTGSETAVAGDLYSFSTTAPVAASAGTLVVDSAAGSASVHSVIYGGTTAVTKFGSNPPTVTLSGTPLGLYAVRIEITTGGARGTALFRLSVDNGENWLLTGQTTSASATLTGTGLTASFSNSGTYQTNNYYLSDSVVTNGIPLDDYDIEIEFTAGGAVGGSSLRYKYSLDDGNSLNLSPELAVVGSFLVVGGVRLDLSGTFEDGDTITLSCTASRPTPAQILAALDSLKTSRLPFSKVLFTFPIGTAEFDAIESGAAALGALNKPIHWFAHPRRPNPGETEAEYKTNALVPLANKTTKRGSVVARDAYVSSSITGREYRRCPAIPVASAEGSVPAHVDTADTTLGALPGVRIVDAGGNTIFHDESVNPGDDDDGFLALRTVDGLDGAYINRPRIKCEAGSDFQIGPYRNVMDLASKLLVSYLKTRLNKYVRVNKKTGFIFGPDATEIERNATRAVMSVLGSGPMVSDLKVTVARDENILSTKTVSVEMAITPLAYIEGISLTERFVNPVRTLPIAA